MIRRTLGIIWLALLLGSCGDFSTTRLLNAELSNSKYITITSVISIAGNIVQVKTKEALDPSVDLEVSDALVHTDGTTTDSLEITGIAYDEDNDNVIFLYTELQVARRLYELRIFRLRGINFLGVPNAGLRSEFTGFDPEAVKREFQIIGPATVVDGEDFTVTVNAFTEGSLIKDMNESVNWDVAGVGDLSIVSSPGWSEGSQVFTVNYSGNVQANTTENIVLTMTAVSDSLFTGQSESITITAPVVIDHFEVSAPVNATVDAPFNVTITAYSNNNEIDTNYNETVNLSAIGATGDLSPLTASSFTNGTVTVPVTFNSLSDKLQIKVEEDGDSSINGISDEIFLGTGIGDNYMLNLSAIALPDGTVRLDWTNFDDAVTYTLSRRVGADSFSEITTVGFDSYTYNDTSTAGSTTYDYKLEAYNAVSALLATGTSQVTADTVTCTEISSSEANNTISGASTWNVTGSPYCIKDDVTVSGTLVITSDTVITFADATGITVQSSGTLTAFGSGTDLVTFTSENPSPSPGDWDGITFDSGANGSAYDAGFNYSSGSGFGYFILEYAGNTTAGINASEPLSIEHGFIRHNSSPAGHGGGIAMANNIVLRYSNISNNECLTGGCLGGGVYITGGSIVRFEKSIFAGNKSDSNGGAIQSATANGVQITDCLVIDNEIVSLQYAVNLAGNTHYIARNKFLDNHNGGLTAQWSTTVTYNEFRGNIGLAANIGNLTNTITYNTFDSNGSALSTSSNGHMIRYNTFSNNTGHAASLAGNSVTFSDNTVDNNGIGVIAGGFAHGITNNVITDNDTGIYWSQLWGSVTFNTLTGNDRAIYAERSDQLSLVDNHITANTYTGDGAGLYIHSLNPGAATITHNNIYSNTASADGDNIFSNEGSTHIATDNYFGGETVDVDIMGICDATQGSVCGNAGTVDVSGGVQATVWPLCSVAPLDTDCVGADF